MQLSVFEMVKKGVSTIIEVVDAFAREQIDELNNVLNTKQNIIDNNLSTNSKEVIGAINELNSKLNLKQNIVDNTLSTTNKNIVGAINEINSDLTHSYFQLISSGSSVNIERQDCWCQGNIVHIAFSATSNGDMPSDYIWGIVPNEYRATSTIDCGFVYIENIPNIYINSVKIESNGYIHQALVSSVPANARVTFIADYFI